MLYEALLRQSYLGQQVINRWHYRSESTPAAVTRSFALTYAMGFIDTAGVYPAGSIFALLRSRQSSGLTYEEVVVRALYDDVDFYTRPWSPPLAALGGGGTSAPFLAYGLQSNRTTLAVRRGSKRFAGVSEGDIESGGALSSGALADMGSIADEMSATLEYDDEGSIIAFAPVVLSFEKYTTPSGKFAYRPYATLSEQEDHMAMGILYSVQPFVRTQNSRQYGRGS